MRLLPFIVYSEVVYHIGVVMGAFGGVYGWYPS
ncbi:Uncharacterised protein [Mycobacteroides abscessus subsp. abscessus]|nr:Uncharacterised protein [Mycobacteroides abscessus subsp. abscessus]SID80395.1 Uncharacterised protein [Mycobacteroides abscessus subsp. abscessus]SIE08444.1 Uncharacterised protein [Mycobacteroides abscessus subsp. abscessus]SIE28643.1 Uncharacterised protein [Mycobacteroides abscessus subsp. abscessus]SIE65042.1 Uncharacterised protein [Mycobacteroides abscessus subsp. abscessus]